MRLKTILLINAVSCLFFGGAFTIFSYRVSRFLSGTLDYESEVLWVGLLLLFNAGHLLKTVVMGPSFWELLYFIAADILWVFLSWSLVLSGTLISERNGVVAALAVSLMVAAFGVAQWLLRAEAKG